MEVLNKKCKHCSIVLTPQNAAKKNKLYCRNECKKCRSTSVWRSFVGNEKRKSYMRGYVRKAGIVKKYNCETCGEFCYKKYRRAFCSDKCRFLSYIEKIDSGCWLWKGYKNRKNYGKLSFQSNRSAIASRVSYELFVGPIEGKLFICHTCDNPSCVNPSHLFAGSHMENMIDMIEKGRSNSKLSPIEVLEIRKMWENGLSQNTIMEKFNIASSTISNIVHRRSWKHV